MLWFGVIFKFNQFQHFFYGRYNSYTYLLIKKKNGDATFLNIFKN